VLRWKIRNKELELKIKAPNIENLILLSTSYEFCDELLMGWFLGGEDGGGGEGDSKANYWYLEDRYLLHLRS